ncbi:hypothetical protein SAMD00023353_0105360 [Rosellinia necatrix]|uniref:Uncharacterized protein n=1 Tax=Rosellinia necatrix TaxID=77044 RepID=A0A1S7UJ16_ROSNE|nr:hypothetical protein SAMD00023353_0105360 [Rosellinia necatrix]
MSFEVLEISAVPDFNTVNRQYECACPKGQSQPLWDMGLKGVVPDGPTGSLRCVTFHLRPDEIPGNRWRPLDITISALSTEVPQWYRTPDQGPPRTYRITAGLPGRAELLASDDIQVLSPDPTPILVKGLRVVGDVYNIPFRNAGDWQWRLQQTGVASAHQTLCETSTRLELCFVFGPSPPSGPWESDEAHRRTAADFEDRHFIDLFRLFLPSQMEVVDSLSSTATARDRALWYLRRTMSTIWGLGLKPHAEYADRPVTQLDVGGGGAGSSSFYLCPLPGVPRAAFRPQYGGRFDLRRWMRGTYAYCTALDLAALAQLACALLQDGAGAEVLDPRWVCATGNASLGQAAFGHVCPGTLFGWPAFPQCNSVVYGAGGLTAYPPARAAERAGLAWHAWVEVLLPGSDTRCVFDASQAPGEDPSRLMFHDGTKTRSEYLALKIDPAWPDPARLPPMGPGRTLQNVDAVICYSTPATHMNRIGVMGISTTLW